MNDKPKEIATMDGNEAAAYAAYALTEVAAIYPITPSSPMAEKTDEWSALGRQNIFTQPVRLVEMQSEAGAIGAVHGALEAGSLAASFTSSQGLMLMLPPMYRIAGTKQPGVLHVASRTVGTHAMSIFGDHSDVMACRGTGFALMCSSSVQEVMDMGGVAHLSAIKGRIPFLHFFDGFRTSHEVQKVECMDYAHLEGLLDKEALKAFRDSSLNPEHPTLRNTVQNPDVYFQSREANNPHYDALPDIVEYYCQKISEITGRDYKLFNYYGAPDAEYIIIAMGSVSGTIMDTVDYLNASGEKYGYVQVRLYRPFSMERFLAAIPKSVKGISVMDRCKEAGAVGEPLYLDVCAAYAGNAGAPFIVGGRYGLSSKDVDPAQIKAVFDNLKASKPRNGFTVGILDDVTGLSLDLGPDFSTESEGTICCKFWGLGSDGTVGANKNSIKIIGDYTDMYTQAYFEYDTKKSFGVTKSHLRFGKNPIRGTHLVKSAGFVACHNQSFLAKYDIIEELNPGGVFLLNTVWSVDELEENMPGHIKKYIADNDIKLYIIDANAISQSLGLGDLSNGVLQAVFFSLANIIPVDDAVKYMKDAVKKSYGLKGEEIVNKNMAAIDAGISGARQVEIPASWKNASANRPEAVDDGAPPFIKNILRPINAQKGDSLPVSAFIGYEDGTMPLGTSAYEKRGIATAVPVWDSEKCLQCNLCSYVCPHAVIRPFLMDEAEVKNAPAGFVTIPAKGAKAKDFKYSMQVSQLDCTGCGSCEANCLAKDKALKMTPVTEVADNSALWTYAMTITDKPGCFPVSTVKGSQFVQPLVEFSGACAGCGETPYAKLLTQLFGDRVYWANATGCSQAWGASMPCIPYTVNKEGKGPAWSNSLFENNAEFSLGQALAVKQQRELLGKKATALKALAPDLAAPLTAWLDAFNSSTASKAASDALIKALENAKLEGEGLRLKDEILERRDQLVKKTIWMYGGDGWAYDIGYGGLAHVFALGEDVNVFVIDTEVYSNTGGQSSKATPLGAAAQFASSGKTSGKMDLGALMRSYNNVYVAQVAMGADPAQLVKALIEADEYPGPSIVIGYTPCIAHGIKIGMAEIQEEMKRAVKSGYWHLYRHNPLNEGNPFTLDSKEPTMEFQDYLKGEVRYASLEMTFPENAKKLFTQAEKDAKAKYLAYKRLAEGNG